jgi:toxin ParE1/3/4
VFERSRSILLIPNSRYLTKIDTAFDLLAAEPQCGKLCDDIRSGYRKYRVGRHLIFYRQSSEGIEIVRILHDQMDIEVHFDREVS